MTTTSSTQKAADAAHEIADEALTTAKGAVKATRQAANASLDKAEKGLRVLRDEVDPAIDDLAARAQDWATRGIGYCADTTQRARRQFHRAADATAHYVTEQPAKSLLLAAAAGAALAMLWTSSRRGDR